MVCTNCGARLDQAFVYCPCYGTKRNDGASSRSTPSSSDTTASTGSTPSRAGVLTTRGKGQRPRPSSFEAFSREKENERQSHFQPKSKKRKTTTASTGAKPSDNKDVLINVGLMEYECGVPKKVFGKNFPVKIPKECGYDELLEKSLKKWEDYDREFSRERGYVLVYPDGKLARTIPGTDEQFTLSGYKEVEEKKDDQGKVTDFCYVESDVRADDDLVDITDLTSSTLLGLGEDLEQILDDCMEEPVPRQVNQDCSTIEPSLFTVEDFLPIGFDENEAVQQAIDNSLNNIPAEEEVVEVHTTSNSETSTECFQSTIKQHANEKVSGDPRTIVVSRLCVWATALPYFKKRGFLKGSGMLQVTLATFEAEEDAVDLGGQRREFFHLLLGAIMTNSGTLTNTTSGHVIRCNVGALQDGKFKVVGRMLATMVVQGGALTRLFSKSICECIQGGFDSYMPTIDEIPDKNVRDSLLKLKEAKTQDEVNACMVSSEWRFDIDGLPAPVPFERRNTFIDEVAKYFVIIKCQPMLQQLLDGLNYYDVLEMIRSNKGMAKHIFEFKAEKLDVNQVLGLMKPDFAPVGSNRRPAEEIVMAKFIAFLKSIQDGNLMEDIEDDGVELTTQEKNFIPTITPSLILMFTTGATNVPSTGFDPSPSITFVHDETKNIPGAQTCSNMLYLYVNEKTIGNSISHYLLTALMNGGVFSKL